MNGNKYKKLVDDICEGCCKSDQYCLFKVLEIEYKKMDPRFLTQLKCLEIYKYEESEREKHDIGWDVALSRWVDQGWAKLFADYYDPEQEVSSRALYTRIQKELANRKS